MKVEINDPRLVAAMIHCFYGDGPTYAEILEENKAAKKKAEEASVDPGETEKFVTEFMGRPIVVPGGGRFEGRGRLAPRKNPQAPTAVTTKQESESAEPT